MFLAEKKLLPLFFIRNLDIQVSVWPHLKVPEDDTAGLGASMSPAPYSKGTGQGTGGGWWAEATTSHTHTTQGHGKQQLKQKVPLGCTEDTHTSTPSPIDHTNPSRTGSHPQPEGHRTALSPCIS